MDRDTFIRYYREALEGKLSHNDGVNLIREYIVEKGNDYQKEHIDTFLNLLLHHLFLYERCIAWVLDYYFNKYSVVLITLEDPNAIRAKVITIY